MKSNIGKKWSVWSVKDPRFDIRGYSPGGRDYEQDAIKAMETLAVHIGKAIPEDIELKVTSTDQ